MPYGNAGNGTVVVNGVTSASTYGGAGNDSVLFGTHANTLSYEGGLVLTPEDCWRHQQYNLWYNASATEAGDDSISIGNTASGSYIYANW